MDKISLILLLSVVFIYQGCGVHRGADISNDLLSESESGFGIDCSAPAPVAKTNLTRLTRKEIYLTLLDYTGYRNFETFNNLPADSASDKGLLNDNVKQVIFEGDATKYFQIFNTIISDTIARGDRRLISCEIEATGCVESIIDNFAYLAHRGVVDTESVEKLKVTAGTFNTPQEQLQYGLVGLLMMPQFLFHSSSLENENETRLNDFQIADRLSFLIWNSAPDRELLEAAEAGQLSTQKGLQAQVDRMFADSKIDRFSYNMAEEWMSLAEVREKFSGREDVSEELVESIVDEPIALMAHVFENELPVSELITANYSFMTQSLADHYGIGQRDLSSVQKDNRIEGLDRMGIFFQTAGLTASNESDVTSPTHRGYWFLKRAFCVPPGHIPAGLNPDDVNLDSSLPARLRLAPLSEGNSSCANCHRQMDPIGLAFENFDAFGSFRVSDGIATIDPSGVLPNGIQFTDARDMLTAMHRSEDYNFSSCFTHHLASRARNMTLEKNNLCTTNQLVQGSRDPSVKDLVEKLVHSDLFRR